MSGAPRETSAPPRWLGAEAAPDLAAHGTADHPAAAPPAEVHHAEVLRALDAAGPPASPAEAALAQARRRWHARWLARATGAAAEPLRVSVVIPSYQDGPRVERAIDSALAQRAGPVEVIVVDDGSTDETPAVLARYGGRVRALRQANAGVAAARNAGAALATGDLLHFLDADDVLDPEAHATWLSGFAASPAADLAYGAVREVDTTTGAEVPRRWAPHGGPGCPTRDLLRAVVAGYPFLPGAMALPRWRWLAAEPFDASLRHAEDDRWYLRLALAGARAVGTDRVVLTRHLAPGRLSSTPASMQTGWARTWLAGVLDLLASPDHWPLLAVYLQQGAWAPRLAALESSRDPQVLALRSALLARVQGLGAAGLCAGRSPSPLLAVLRGLARHMLDARAGSEAPPSGVPAPAFADALGAAAKQALASAPPTGPADWRLWLGAEDASPAQIAAEDHLLGRSPAGRRAWRAAPPDVAACLAALPEPRRSAVRRMLRAARWSRWTRPLAPLLRLLQPARGAPPPAAGR